MANSELSRFIEEEMARKGIHVDERETRRLMETSTHHMDIENAVRERHKKRSARNLKRNVCIGGSLLIAIIILFILVQSSKTVPKPIGNTASASDTNATDEDADKPPLDVPKPDGKDANTTDVDAGKPSPEVPKPDGKDANTTNVDAGKPSPEESKRQQQGDDD